VPCGVRLRRWPRIVGCCEFVGSDAGEGDLRGEAIERGGTGGPWRRVADQRRVDDLMKDLVAVEVVPGREIVELLDGRERELEADPPARASGREAGEGG